MIATLINTIDTLTDARTVRAGFVRRLVIVSMAMLDWVEAMAERRRSRLALLEMSEDQLKDIGLSRSQAYCEGSRPFWNGAERPD